MLEYGTLGKTAACIAGILIIFCILLALGIIHEKLKEWKERRKK